MASPFAVFRRNQRILVAIAGITAMVAFVFLDPLMKYVGSNAKAENPVVVETRYGGLTGSQLDGMRYSRELVARFLQNVTTQTVLVQLEKGLIDPRLREQAAGQLNSFWYQTLMGRSKLGPEEAAVETMVMAKKAEQLGMVVSDTAINDLIKQITDNSLDSATLQAVINQLQGGRQKVSTARLFDALRTEMLASKLSQLFFQSLRDIPPAQRFEYYERLNRKAKAEILPLAVASFVDQVATEPTNVELLAFYDKHKNAFPNPASPEPGFKEPKRASFQYFKADFAKLKDEFKPQVTEAEIREYYEKNKAQFRVVELPGEDADKDKPADDEKSGEKPEEKATEEKAAEPPKAEEPKAQEPKGETPKPEEPKSEEPKTEEPKPESETPQPQASRGAGVFQFVSQAAPGDEKSAEEKASDEKPAQEKPADAQPASEPASGTEPPATVEPPAEASAEKPAEEIKYEPLEKVQDTIRDTIAGEKANNRMIEIFDELQAAMRRYADDRDLFAARPDAKTNAAAAPVFPFEELAKGKNVEARSLDLVTSAEAATSDIGQVQRTVRRSQFDFRNEPFNEFAFAESLVKFKPEAGQDGEGNGYLFWKTDEKPAFVPPLATIRDRVVYAWKMIKARELAQKRADELAGQARAAKKPLAEVFAGQADLKVTETAPFSWLTTGNVPQDPFASQPRLSDVDGVEYPGEAFMKAVFALSPGEIGVASNNPQDTYYVVRLVDFDRPIDELRNEFAIEPPARYMAVADNDRREIYRSWLSDLEREAKVHWLRPADSVSRRGEPDDIPSETAGL